MHLSLLSLSSTISHINHLDKTSLAFKHSFFFPSNLTPVKRLFFPGKNLYISFRDGLEEGRLSLKDVDQLLCSDNEK